MIKESIQEIAAHPAPLFARYFAIEAVFLVGSHAEGRTRPNSDLDLALRDPRAQLGAHTIDIRADEFLGGLEALRECGKISVARHRRFVPQGRHIFANEGFGIVNQSRDVPRLFGEQGISRLS